MNQNQSSVSSSKSRVQQQQQQHSQSSSNILHTSSSQTTVNKSLQESSELQQQHHRKSVITENSEQMTNAILTRKSTDKQNDMTYSKGVSMTGAQQRKSIHNLHEQSQYSSGNVQSTDRKSLSYIHRTGGSGAGMEHYHSSECQLHPQKSSMRSSSTSQHHQVIQGYDGGHSGSYSQETRNYERSSGGHSHETRNYGSAGGSSSNQVSKTSQSSINFGQSTAESRAYQSESSRQMSSSSTSRNVHSSSVTNGSSSGGGGMQTITNEYRIISSSGGLPSSTTQYSTKIVSTPTAGASSIHLANQNRSVRRHQATSSNIVFGGYDNNQSSSQSRFSTTTRSEYVKDTFKPCPASHLDKNHMKQTRATKSHQFYLREE